MTVLDSLESALAALGSTDHVQGREREAFDELAQGKRRVVILGCGHLGTVSLSGAIAAGLDVLAFADNNPENWGRTLRGVPVLSPEEALRQFNEEAFFVVAVYNGTPPRRQLLDLGCRRIVPYPMYFWRFSLLMPQEDRLELPHRILQNKNEMRCGYGLLSDEKSRQEFAAQIRWRCTLDYECLPSPDPAANMYYPPELVSLEAGETLVDCGAYDGDSIRAFLDQTGHSFRCIYALEPDPKNCAALKAYLESIPKQDADRIFVLPVGASDHHGTESFNASGTVGSGIVSAGGNETIACRTLDDLLTGTQPTFIKMDIEGAEPGAIMGATETIRRARPIVAACAYHRCEHLWTLPMLLNAALPEYRIFLRRYAEECWETVYYAIPPERIISVRGEM